MTTRIFVQLDFIDVAALLPPVPVIVLADVVERHLQGIGAHAEVSIGHFLAYGVYVLVELKLHAKAARHVLHQIVDRAFIPCLKRLRHTHRRHCQQGSNQEFSHRKFF